MKNIDDIERKYEQLLAKAQDAGNENALHELERTAQAIFDFKHDDCGCGEVMRRQMLKSMLNEVEHML
ncbi:MAG: hypothetical protein ACOYJJ_09905 [Anaerovoracaceae bacterium]|jgi:hypothetical protein